METALQKLAPITISVNGKTHEFLDPSLHDQVRQIEKLNICHGRIQMALALPFVCALLICAMIIGGIFIYFFIPLIGKSWAETLGTVIASLLAGFGGGLEIISSGIRHEKKLNAAGLSALLEAEDNFRKTNPELLEQSREVLLENEKKLLAALRTCREQRNQLEAKLGLPPYRE